MATRLRNRRIDTQVDDLTPRNRFVDQMEDRNRTRGSSSGGSTRRRTATPRSDRRETNATTRSGPDLNRLFDRTLGALSSTGLIHREPASQPGPRTTTTPRSDRRGSTDTQEDSGRSRLDEATQVDPLDEARRSQEFLGQSAEGFANMLMPNLQQGLQAARSRFGGGAIRSGGAQQAEEQAFQRLFADPLSNRISQLATTSLGFGERSADREFGQAFDVRESDRSQNRFLTGLGEDRRQFDLGLEERQRQFDERETARRRAGVGAAAGEALGFLDDEDASTGEKIGGVLGTAGGSLLGPVGGAVGGFLGKTIGGLF